jgi:predicted thioesterase
MNLQALSEVVMSEQFVVPPLPGAEVARAETGVDETFKKRFAAVFNNAYLLANIEGYCIEELADCISPVYESVVGTGVDFKHVKTANCGSKVSVKGYVVEVADRAVIFFVTATQNGELIGSGTLRFAIMSRAVAAAREARPARSEAPTVAKPSRFAAAQPVWRYQAGSRHMNGHGGTASSVQCSL